VDILAIELFELTSRVSHSRWRFAQANERDYQRRKAAALGDRMEALMRSAQSNSGTVSEYLCGLGLPVNEGTVVEVGSGASGLIWRWSAEWRIAIELHLYEGDPIIAILYGNYAIPNHHWHPTIVPASDGEDCAVQAVKG